MRMEFINAKNRKQAVSRCPWAAIVARTEGGYVCFESWNDYYAMKHITTDVTLVRE